MKVKGQIYVFFFLYVSLLLPGPWADLHQTVGKLRAAPDISSRGSFFQRSRSSRSKVKFLYLCSPLSDLHETW